MHENNTELVERMSYMTKLNLQEDEKEKIGQELGQMLSYMEKIKEVCTDGVKPLVTVGEYGNILREDEVTNESGCVDILTNAPEAEEGGIVVPKTIG